MIQKLKEKPLGFWLVLSLMTIPFTYLLMYDQFHVSLALFHRFAGLVAILLLVLLIKDRKPLWNQGREVRWMIVSAALFLLSTLIGQLLNFHPIYYLSGLNNILRFFLFFFACILYLKEDDRDRFMRIIDALFWLNFAVTLYQFFVLGIKWDYLGGIFGTGVGCSGSSNNLLVLSVTGAVVRYLNQKEKTWFCLATCAASLVIAALAELRMFFLMFAAIVGLTILMTKFSWRKIYLLIGAAIFLLVASQLLILVFPFWSGWYNLTNIISYSTGEAGYMGFGDYNRLTAVPKVWAQFLTSDSLKLFGMGLGNCDFGFTSALTPAFYNEHYMLNYTLFTDCFILLETGLVGFLLYIGFFLLILVAAWRLLRSGKGDPVYCQMGIIMACYALLLFVYDSSLRTECGYLIYTALALPFLGKAKTE